MTELNAARWWRRETGEHDVTQSGADRQREADAHGPVPVHVHGRHQDRDGRSDQRVSFDIRPSGNDHDPERESLPHVDNVSLIELISGYEHATGFDIPGAYACEVGCCPLQAQVLVDDDHVTWRGFRQPFRPQRDYGSFGPLVFRRSQYERAVRDAARHA